MTLQRLSSRIRLPAPSAMALSCPPNLNIGSLVNDLLLEALVVPATDTPASWRGLVVVGRQNAKLGNTLYTLELRRRESRRRR